MAQASNIPGVASLSKYSDKDWQAQLNDWHAILTELALAFKQGQADVNPKDPQTCQHCDLHTLCRIQACSPHPPSFA